MKLREVLSKFRISQTALKRALMDRYKEPVIQLSRLSNLVSGVSGATETQAKRIKSSLKRDFDIPADVVANIPELIKK